jgi:hypothetical protein
MYHAIHSDSTISLYWSYGHKEGGGGKGKGEKGQGTGIGDVIS